MLMTPRLFTPPTHRSSPQVIRGKPVHLTESVDGAVPAGATGGGASPSGGCTTSWRRRRRTSGGCQAFITSDCSFQTRGMGLVVVRDGKVLGLHCSGPELHAGQAAIIHHGVGLADCQLYFSRRPCATCLKMIINGERGTGFKQRRSPYSCINTGLDISVLLK